MLARPTSNSDDEFERSVEGKSLRCAIVAAGMGSLVKKRRKRMRKKKHKKMLKRTRAQRQRGR